MLILEFKAEENANDKVPAVNSNNHPGIGFILVTCPKKRQRYCRFFETK